MKIRANYVSNSSSSSFIVKSFNKDKMIELLCEFIDTIDFNSDDNKYYNACGLSVKECFLKKLCENEKQENYLEIYIKSGIYNIFCNVFDSFIFERQYKCIDHDSCEDKNNCKGCYFDYFRRKSEEYREEYERDIEDFPEFNFNNEIKEIREIVYEAEIKNINDVPHVETKWADWDKKIKGWSEKHFKEWKKCNPNAFVLSFASDDGDMTEAFLRFNVVELAKFMKENGIEGFNGENS